MKSLPVAKDPSSCFELLGFIEMSTSKEDVQQRYRELVKQLHPDVGGSQEEFQNLQDAYKQACQLLEQTTSLRAIVG